MVYAYIHVQNIQVFVRFGANYRSVRMRFRVRNVHYY